MSGRKSSLSILRRNPSGPALHGERLHVDGDVVDLVEPSVGSSGDVEPGQRTVEEKQSGSVGVILVTDFRRAPFPLDGGNCPSGGLRHHIDSIAEHPYTRAPGNSAM